MLPARAQQRATTADGQTVILHEDGTWERAGEAAPESRAPSDSAAVSFARPSSAAEYVEGANVDYQLWYDADTWKKMPGIQQQNPDVEHSFAHAEGGAQAMIISERLYIPLEKMKRVALLNMMEEIPDAKIVEEEWREVNGRRILSLKLEGTARQVIPLTYRGYYYSQEGFGTVQVLAYTGSSLYGEVEKDIEDLLNGFMARVSETE